jgi:hypothetical protein
MAMHLRPSLAGAVVALLAVPAAATAASPSPAFAQALKKCYVSAAPGQTEPIDIRANNFMTFAPIDIFIDDVPATLPPDSNPPTADANGELVGSVFAPYMASGQRFFTLRLTERSKDPAVPGPSVSARSKVTALSVTSSPVRPSSTSTPVRFRGRGFTDRLTPIYAHYVFKNRVRETVRIGKPFGDCGQFSVRRRQFPFKNPHTGNWTVQFDQEQAYNPKALVFTRLKIVVSRKPGSRS